jgi:hypothetical protein
MHGKKIVRFNVALNYFPYFHLQMLKHVQISPLRNRSDSISLRSSTSFSLNSSCASSLCGSPEPSSNDYDLKTSSRSSSFSSLNDAAPQVKEILHCHFNYSAIKISAAAVTKIRQLSSLALYVGRNDVAIVIKQFHVNFKKKISGCTKATAIMHTQSTIKRLDFHA